MHIERLEHFSGGWFVGNFAPTLINSDSVEVCVKRYPAGTTEPVHFQRTAIEVTLIISGRCKIGGREFGEDDFCIIPPLEAAGFEALTDVVLVAVKSPSLPTDKELGVVGNG